MGPRTRTLVAQRLPIALSAMALAVAIVGTPASEGAFHGVRSALFASNAGAVNGIKASHTPHSGRLLALNANGHFPSSVLAIPKGPQGPQGVSGPPGIQGLAGISHAYQHGSAEVSIGTPPTTLATLGLPAGRYLVIGHANLSDLDTAGTSGICDLHVVGSPPLENDDEDYYSLAAEGTAPWRRRLALFVAVDFTPNGGQVEMTCHSDTASTVHAQADWVVLDALEVGSLTSSYSP